MHENITITIKIIKCKWLKGKQLYFDRKESNMGKKAVNPWNNGKSGAKLDLTSSTTPGLQIHTVDHIRTANPCDWLLCCRAALLLVGCPHSLVYLHLPVVDGLIFWEPPSHYSMAPSVLELPILYDLCVSVPISHLLTMGSMFV